MSEERDRERCGEAIPARRLEALPNTRLCIECSQAIGGDYVTYVIPEHTGKPGSLKRNYGGVATSKSRNQEALRRLREEFEQMQERK